MNSDQTSAALAPHVVLRALAELKLRLQRLYEQAYPELREIIRLVLDEEEAVASQSSPFPHLFFPDLVEAHLATLNLLAPATVAVDGPRALQRPLSSLALA